jgi:hypothetical protein
VTVAPSSIKSQGGISRLKNGGSGDAEDEDLTEAIYEGHTLRFFTKLAKAAIS